MTSTDRPDVAHGISVERYTPIGKAFITVNYWEGKPREIFVRVGKAGTLTRAFSDVIGRLCSTALQHGTPIPQVCKQLRKVRSQESRGRLDSLPEVVAEVLEDYTNGY